MTQEIISSMKRIIKTIKEDRLFKENTYWLAKGEIKRKKKE